MKYIKYLLIAIAVFNMLGCSKGKDEEPSLSLIPDRPSMAPDYFCTWNIQGYAANYDGPSTEALMNEESLFGIDSLQGWTQMWPAIRKDLYFVMDDSWDVPKGINFDRSLMGTAQLDTTRFPSFKGEPVQRLKDLSERVKSLGWKGLGGWISAQEPSTIGNTAREDYWKQRLLEAEEAGIAYWKVDFGHEENNNDWRHMLTALGHQYAPHLTIEHAYGYDCIEFSDVFRTYDVENIIAQPVTIDRVARLLSFQAQQNAGGIINCEDEPYIAAGLGCAIGIMRHPLAGPLPNGLPDHVFPSTNRDLKHRLNEVIRGVRWHRIAEPFGVDNNYLADTLHLDDWWVLAEHETWVHHEVGDTIRASAPARISRHMPLPEVGDTSPSRPYVLASRYPSGATSVSAIGRVIDRCYISLPVPVSITIEDPLAPIGIFGFFERLSLHLTDSTTTYTILAQDLAGDMPVEITSACTQHDGCITIPGDTLAKIGSMAATDADRSDPALVLQLIPIVKEEKKSCSMPGDAATDGYDVAAYVWPAYHDDPRWHEIGLFPKGKGEWEVVSGATPRFNGHQQPRKPLWGYQDESSPSTQEQAIRCALAHGVNTFIFDWYWFDNRPFLQDVLDKGFLNARSNEKMKFFLMWANHTANAYWDPHESDKSKIYWHGETSRADFDGFTDHLINDYFLRPNYYRINGCPVFAIYEVGTFIRGMGGISPAREALDAFRKRCIDAGLPGLHLMAIAWSALPASLSDTPGDDTPTQGKTLAALGFESATNYQWCHLVPADREYEAWGTEGIRHWNSFSHDLDVPFFPHVSLGWDPNPRYPADGPAQPCVTGVTANVFEGFLRDAKRYIDLHPSQPHLITINAWNEWSEGSCLEPDTHSRYSYLNAVRNVFGPASQR